MFLRNSIVSTRRRFLSIKPNQFRTMASNNNQDPSVIGGHVQYAKGYVEEAIGNATGSKEWQDSGKKDAKEGIESMKAASQNKSEPTPSTLGGKIEQAAGQAAGCEGMEKEGAVRQQKAQ